MVLKLLVGLGFVIVFGVGVYDFVFNHETNRCQMTYMYEYPEYLPISLSKSLKKKFPTYGLFLYSEGAHASHIVNSRSALNGIPVLFIPGNAGSYKQVRSLGSVSLRMTESLGSPFHFDYFVADLNEEYGGLSGIVLKRQSLFVCKCISAILKLYKKSSNPPATVILVGHSVGGVIARHVTITCPNNKVRIIFTKATPHTAPVVTIDWYISDFYRELANKSRALVFSLSGGYRDKLVRSDLAGTTFLEQNVPAVNSMSVPNAWASTDHLCIIWCRQIVLAVVRMLFDLVDSKTLQITSDKSLMTKAWNHHFVYNYGPKFLADEKKSTPFSDSTITYEHVTKSFLLNCETFKTPKVILIETEITAQVDSLLIVGDFQADNWLFGCTKNNLKEQRNCLDPVDLSPLGRIIPSTQPNRKLFSAQLKDLKQFSHLALYVSPKHLNCFVGIDLYEKATRHMNLTSFAMTNLILDFPESLLSLFKYHTVLTTQRGQLFYRLNFPLLSSVLQAFRVTLSPKVTSCDESLQLSYSKEATMMHFHVPWSKEDVYRRHSYANSLDISVKLQTAKPNDAFFDNKHPYLDILLHPACEYRLEFKHSLPEMFGQYVRFFGILLPGFIVINVIMAFAYQVQHLFNAEDCPTFYEAHSAYAQPYRTVPIAVILSIILNGTPVSHLSNWLGLPEDDISAVSRQGFTFPMFPVALYMTAYFLTIFIVSVLQFVFHLTQLMFNAFVDRFFANALLKVFTVLRNVLLLLSLAVAATVCGVIGMAISHCILILSTFRAKKNTMFNAHRCFFSFVILHKILLILQFPSLLSWFRDFSVTSELTMTEDASRSYAVLSCISILLLGLHVCDGSGFGIFRHVLVAPRVLSTLSGIAIALFGFRTLYVVSVNISLIIFLFGFCSLLSKWESNRAKGHHFKGE